MEQDEMFALFWAEYPRKVGKLAAQAAYQKALKLATPDVILAGVRQYKRTKPAYADWAHPTTWLNQGRWLDEEDTPAVSAEWVCPHEPHCLGRHACHLKAELARIKNGVV